MSKNNVLWDDFSFFCGQLVYACDKEFDLYKIINDKNLKTNDELLEYCLKNKEISYFLEKKSEKQINNLSLSCKSDKEAKTYQENAKILFDNKNYLEAAENYLISLCYASDDISLNENSLISNSYANRANCFLNLKNYKYALEDAKKAIDYGYTDKKTLEEIIHDCEINLKCNSTDNNSLNESNNKENFTLNNIFIENATDKIELANDEIKGRKLIAIDLIEPGVKLISEQPFVAQLFPEYSYQFCNFCFTELKGFGIPCSECSFYVCCSNECALRSVETHKEECRIFSDLNNFIGVGYLIIKIILKQGIDNLIKIDLDSLKCSDKYLSNYTSVFNLLTHENKFDLKENLMFTLAAITLKNLLCKLKNVSLNDFQSLKLCQIVMHHIQQLCTNLISIEHLINCELIRSDFKELNLSIGVGLYPVVSLLNHSCIPNVFARFNGVNLQIISTRKIKTGDEVLFCYGPSFYNSTRNDRQLMLKEQYFFDCDCEACKSIQENKRNAFLCQHCNGPVIENNNKKNFCLNCKKKDLPLLMDLYNEGNKLLKNGEFEFENKNFETALSFINEAYIKFIDCLHRHNNKIRICLDLLIDCLIESCYYSAAEEYSFIYLSLLEEIFGKKSIECLRVLAKICKIKNILIINKEKDPQNLLTYIDGIKNDFLPLEEEVKSRVNDFKGYKELDFIKYIEKELNIFLEQNKEIFIKN